jgi:hypothetical protein
MSYSLTYNLVIRVIVIRITWIKRYKKQGNGFALLFLKKVSNFAKSSLYNIDFHFAFIYFIRHKAKMHYKGILYRHTLQELTRALVISQ